MFRFAPKTGLGPAKTPDTLRAAQEKTPEDRREGRPQRRKSYSRSPLRGECRQQGAGHVQGAPEARHRDPSQPITHPCEPAFYLSCVPGRVPPGVRRRDGTVRPAPRRRPDRGPGVLPTGTVVALVLGASPTPSDGDRPGHPLRLPDRRAAPGGVVADTVALGPEGSVFVGHPWVGTTLVRPDGSTVRSPTYGSWVRFRDDGQDALVGSQERWTDLVDGRTCVATRRGWVRRGWRPSTATSTWTADASGAERCSARPSAASSS